MPLDAGSRPTLLLPTRTGLVITHLFGICCRLMLAASDENRLVMAHLSMLTVDHADCQRRELVLGHDIVPLGGVRYARRVDFGPKKA